MGLSREVLQHHLAASCVPRSETQELERVHKRPFEREREKERDR